LAGIPRGHAFLYLPMFCAAGNFYSSGFFGFRLSRKPWISNNGIYTQTRKNKRKIKIKGIIKNLTARIFCACPLQDHEFIIRIHFSFTSDPFLEAMSGYLTALTCPLSPSFLSVAGGFGAGQKYCKRQ